MRVCIFVANNCTVDSRILRQAETFAGAGHETRIVAVHRGDVPAFERRGGFEIHRVSAEFTWGAGYPRIAKVLEPLRALGSAVRPARHPAGDQDDVPIPAPIPPPPAAPGPRLSPRQWIRWILTGGEPSPRSWDGGRPSFTERLKIVVFMPSHVFTKARRVGRRIARRRIRRARRVVRRRFMLSTRYRQLEREMAREAIAFKADLYWANDVQTMRPAAAAARATGARVVYDAHEVVWDAPTVSRFRQLVWAMIELTQIRKMDRVFTVCDPIADLMAKRYRIARPTVVLNCPRLEATAATAPRESSPLNGYRRPGERIVLFHGYLAPLRGLEELIAAIELLPAEYRLVVLGHGLFRETLEELTGASGAGDRVTFLESVPPSELPAWIVGADVGTIPYQSRGRNHEFSTPNKLFEYLHLGVPIVANELPEIRRIVDEVGFGIIADCSDPATIAKAVQDLLSDQVRYDEMRSKARAAADRYSWERQEAAVLSALEP